MKSRPAAGSIPGKDREGHREDSAYWGLQVLQVDLPLHEGRYESSGGKSVTMFDSAIVRVVTEDGLVRHGEVCPLVLILPAGVHGRRADWPCFVRTCWDILGQVAVQSVCLPLVKVGDHPHKDIARIDAVRAQPAPGDRLIADANTGWWMHETLRVSTADGAPQRQAGRLAAGTAPGMGIRPRPEVLGAPVLVI